jgi:hypothetical protein
VTPDELFQALVDVFADALAKRLATPRDAPDRLLSAREAGALLNVSKDTLYGSDELKPLRVKVGRRILFSLRAAQDFIARRAGR